MNSNQSAPKDQPPTSAKIVLYTSHGEIDLELWTKEAPLACRNFIQLSMEGYYNNTIFHRMIPGFMIQGGDPSGTGTGGQSIYGRPFNDQFHQRLKFTRRGILAMANAGKNTNRSQFFITFGQCQHLNKKHTIFGKVVGDTIFNLLSMQSLDTDKQDRPTQPPTIKKVKILVNPFQDIVPREVKKPQPVIQQPKVQQLPKKQPQIKQKSQLKKLKQKNRLTFDDEQQNYQPEKIKSSHDLLNNDKTLSKNLALTQQEITKRKQEKQQQQRKKQQLQQKIQKAAIAQQSKQAQDYKQMLQQQITRKRKMEGNSETVSDQILNYQKKHNPQTNKMEIVWTKQQPIQQQQQESQHIQDQKLRKVRQLQIKQYQALKVDELNFKKIKEGSLRQRRKQRIDEEKALLSNVQRRKYEFIKKNKEGAREGQLLKKLTKFNDRLFKDTPGDWMTHQLKFHIDSENAYKIVSKRQGQMDRQFQVDDGLEIIDEYGAKRQGLDIDELYELTKKDNQQ